MRKIRRVRTYLEQHKFEQKTNVLWCVIGLVLVPAITGIFGLIKKLPAEWLSVLVVTEVISLTVLLFLHILTLDKLKLIERYLKDQGVTWREVEDEVEHSEAFDKAVDEIERN